VRKLGKNKKGLSVIFGVLILIAIAVIAGIIIYLYTSGYLATMMGGGGAGQEKVAIIAVSGVGATDIVTVSAKSVGGGATLITDAILKDASGNVIGAPVAIASGGTPIGNLPADASTVTLTTAAFGGAGLTAGDYYTVTLVSKLGNTFVSQTFKAS